MVCNTVSMSKRGIQKMLDKTTFLDVGFTKETKLVSSIICGKFLAPLPLKRVKLQGTSIQMKEQKSIRHKLYNWFLV